MTHTVCTAVSTALHQQGCPVGMFPGFQVCSLSSSRQQLCCGEEEEEGGERSGSHSSGPSPVLLPSVSPECGEDMQLSSPTHIHVCTTYWEHLANSTYMNTFHLLWVWPALISLVGYSALPSPVVCVHWSCIHVHVCCFFLSSLLSLSVYCGALCM